MIGIERVQEYLDLIFKASVLSRAGQQPNNLQLNSSQNSFLSANRKNSRRPSETSQSLIIANATVEIEKLKNDKIAQLEDNLK